ncbi:hypothetical protein G6W57_00825 [Streptomyces sp. CAI-121]|uniref:hypothetical protein n=1 Tax=unclassified Streptomyces TaxID=2593676 RepID=UPI0015870291|nr:MULTISPECIES: hypothetical protein [unclassified Streptomyces]NUV65658.1 hypothetical protein [Streptomyces sp. CAI-121]NUW12395.1 hypothetical protein [Streptomyces sp. CAI-68]
MAKNKREADVPQGVMAKDLWERFRELHAEGLGRNAIAREMGKCGSVVSRTAEHLELTFDRSRIEAATAARLADLAERRSILAEQLTSDAERLRKKLWEPTFVYAFGGAQNIYNSEPVDEPPPADKRSLMTTAGTAIDKSLKLVPAEANTGGADEAKSMLGKLAQGISAIVNESAETPPEDEL